VLAALSPGEPTLVLGQGTGPAPVDRAELAAIASRIPRGVPLGTALHHFGHTLGASGLLSVALAAIAHRATIPSALALPGRFAPDGRPLVTGPVAGRETVVVNRALGARAGCIVDPNDRGRPAGAPAPAMPPPPLRDPNPGTGRAPAHRPARPPDLLLVRLEAPLFLRPTRGSR
jgi:hypothetical protein